MHADELLLSERRGELAHFVRLVAAADALRNVADGEFDMAEEAQEYVVTCRRNGDMQSSVAIEVKDGNGVVLGGFEL